MRASIKIGSGESVEVRPGIWEDVITEVSYLAEVRQRTEAFSTADSVLPQYRTTTSVSVLTDRTLRLDNSDLRYVLYGGVRWSISSAVHEPPRLTLFVGEEYNGPLPDGTP